MTFAQLHLHERVLAAVQAEGYDTPTPIQQQAIPVVLDGKDIFGCAQTGTGKTAAFALPILHRLAETIEKGPRVLVLAPTRELAVQIGDSFRTYGRNVRFRQVLVYGGVSMRPQIDALRRGVDVIIATPGRLLDLMEQRAVRLDRIETLVLDEADRMLDMGFIQPIRQIIAEMPEQRQTLFFSATIPDEIKKLASGILTNPVNVSVTPVSSATETVEQMLYVVRKDNKRALLTHLLNEDLEGSVLIFTRTKRNADRVAKDLAAEGIRAESLHGDKSQMARQRALDNFKNRRTRVLVATDIAARGIDIDTLPYVINYDVPDTAETYVHRIGRTGRAGSTGIALTLCTPDEQHEMRSIERHIRRQITRVQHHEFSSSESRPTAHQERREPRNSDQVYLQHGSRERTPRGGDGYGSRDGSGRGYRQETSSSSSGQAPRRGSSYGRNRRSR